MPNLIKSKPDKNKDNKYKEGHYPTNILKKWLDGPGASQHGNTPGIHTFKNRFLTPRAVYSSLINSSRTKRFKITVKSKPSLQANTVEQEGVLGKYRRQKKDVP